MNFKPTLWKMVVSILVAVLIIHFDTLGVKGITDYNVLLNAAIFSFIWVWGLIGVYIVWSLFQKRKTRR